MQDPITKHDVKRPETTDFARRRYISAFYEKERSAHHSPDYSIRLRRNPELFGINRTEFLAYNNALPTTSLIIRSKLDP